MTHMGDNSCGIFATPSLTLSSNSEKYIISLFPERLDEANFRKKTEYNGFYFELPLLVRNATYVALILRGPCYKV